MIHFFFAMTSCCIVARADVPRAIEAVRYINTHDYGTIGDGVSDDTVALGKALADLRDGDAILIPAGTYIVKAGTSYTISSKVAVVADGARIVNARFLLLSDVSIRGLTLIERDCYFDASAPSSCPVSTPLITIGYKGYPIHRAVLEGVTLSFTRAYTGIAMGYDTLEHVIISDVDIQANALSGISIYGGDHILISDGTIRGGDMPVVDDGIAITALYKPINDVRVSNITARDIFDLVGIGAEMIYPTNSISVTSSECIETAACIYVKLGNDTRLPGVVGKFSMLDGLFVSQIKISDPMGKRYLTSVWLAAAAEAKGQNISISRITTVARGATPDAVAAKFFLTSTSQIGNVTLRKFQIDTPDAQAGSGGYMPAGGVLIQVWGAAVLSDLFLLNSSFSQMSKYAVDSTMGKVYSLVLNEVSFKNVQGTPGPANLVKGLIPYRFGMDNRLVGD